MPDRTRCRSCRAWIFWLDNLVTGRPAPIDAKPSADGNVLPVRRRDGLSDACTIDEADAYAVLGRAALEARKEPLYPLHMNHFVTCPNAAQHGKARRQ